MPSTRIWQAFHESNCIVLTCVVEDVRLGRATVSKLRESLGGKRKNLPFRFATTYGADRKEKIGAVAELHRGKGDRFTLFIKWFRVEFEPPEPYGRFSDFVNNLSNAVGDKEAYVIANFSYDRDRRVSIFSPIHVGSEAGIFDEIVGFTGIKRSTEGKLLYSLETRLRSKQLEHTVTFSQTIRLSEDVPLGLLDIANRVSNLGLKRAEPQELQASKV